MMVKNAGVPPIVIVSTVSPGSLCDGLMKEMDHIIEVSNEGITDREQCKLLILNAFKTAQKVVLFVDRASGPKAIDDMERLMNASLMMPSVEMRSDVRDICKRFNVKVHTTPAGQPKVCYKLWTVAIMLQGIMRQAGLAPAANVKMTDKPVQQLIAADMSCRIPQLQKVPQKKAPPPPRPTTPPPPPAPAPAPAAPASAAPPADAPSQEKRLSRENAQQEASQEQASENTQNEKSGADEGGSAEDATKQN